MQQGGGGMHQGGLVAPGVQERMANQAVGQNPQMAMPSQQGMANQKWGSETTPLMDQHHGGGYGMQQQDVLDQLRGVRIELGCCLGAGCFKTNFDLFAGSDLRSGGVQVMRAELTAPLCGVTSYSFKAFIGNHVYLSNEYSRPCCGTGLVYQTKLNGGLIGRATGVQDNCCQPLLSYKIEDSNGFPIFTVPEPKVPFCCPGDRIAWNLQDPKSGTTVAQVAYVFPTCCDNARVIIDFLSVFHPQLKAHVVAFGLNVATKMQGRPI